MTKRAALVKVRARSRSSLGAPTPPLRHSCAGRNPHPHIPFPNSSLPPSRGEVRWGVEAPSHRHQPCAPRSPISLLLRRIPRPPTSFLRPLRHSCAGRNPHPHILFPNSSLPPSRGEVRWGVEEPRAAATSRARPDHPSPSPHVIPAPPSSVIPAQAGTHTRTSPSPIHPSPLPGGRLGGGWKAPSRRHQPCAPRSPIPLPPTRHSCTPPSVIPAQAGTRTPIRHSCAPLRHSCAGRNDEGGRGAIGANSP